MTDSQRDILNFFYRSFSSDIGLLSGQDLDGSSISAAQPLLIYDLTGEKLFVDFDIISANGSSLGTVRSSARQKQLPLIDSIRIGHPWFDTLKATAAAKGAAANAFGPVVDAVVICYGYPRIGIMVTCRTQAGTHTAVYDAGVGVLVKQWDGKFSPTIERGAALDSEGQPFYSVLQRVPEAGGLIETPSARQWDQLQYVFGKATMSGLFFLTVDSLNDPIRFAVRGALLPARLISQNTEVFCAVATAAMMLSFVGITKTQDEIAAAMNTSATGTTPANFIQAISALSANKYEGDFFNAPTFNECIQLMENMLPAKSGIPNHARLLRGWREYIIFDNSGQIVGREQFVIINDPYPTMSGQLVLENFAKPVDSYFTNLVSLRKSP
jgi:hypothetical protein